MAELLVKLADGGIKEINTDSDYTGGCETCDWGSSYVNEFTVYLTQGTLYVEYDQSYEYALSEGFLMQLFLGEFDYIRTLTEGEFIKWLREQFVEETGWEPDRYELNGGDDLIC